MRRGAMQEKFCCLFIRRGPFHRNICEAFREICEQRILTSRAEEVATYPGADLHARNRRRAIGAAAVAGHVEGYDAVWEYHSCASRSFFSTCL